MKIDQPKLSERNVNKVGCLKESSMILAPRLTLASAPAVITQNLLDFE
jgi:hypothetical protein